MKRTVFIVLLLAGPAAADPEIVTVTAARLPGGTIDPAKLPGEVKSLSISELTLDRQTDVLPSLVAEELPGVSLNDEQGSPFQPDLVYRGFKASPISVILTMPCWRGAVPRSSYCAADGVDCASPRN